MKTNAELLEMYTDLVLMTDQARADKQAQIDKVITPEIKEQLDDIEAEFAPTFQRLEEKKTMVESQLKAMIIAAGERKVAGTQYTATLIMGRTTWDTKTLEGMIALVPQIEVARKTGDPSVRITANKR